MFNGLKKIVSKNAASEDNTYDSQKILENTDSIHAPNIKSTKKRKVDYLDSPNTKKKYAFKLFSFFLVINIIKKYIYIYIFIYLYLLILNINYLMF